MSLVLRNVSKKYPNGSIGALDVDLTVERGTFVALFGPSGSGKTSQLHMIGLLQRPDTGQVVIDGDRVDEVSETEAAEIRRTKLGFVFQSASLLNLLSAYENIDVSLRLLGVRGKHAKAAVMAALDAVDMQPRADHRPDEMSGGEQQRIAIARALVHEPNYVLADEPTGELDTVTGASILALLRRIADAGTTVVMATHDPAALAHVDEAYFIESGRLHRPRRDELNLWLTEGTSLSTES
ncbi:MAG: ABC transporter ATP-binding protein [Actinomycetota bacterium]